MLLLRVPDGSTAAELAKISDADPFVQHGVAEHERQAWNVTIGRESLDSLK